MKRSFATSDKAKNSASNKVFREQKQSVFQELEKFPGTVRMEENGFYFNLKKFSSNFETYDMPPGIYEVSDIENTLIKLVEAEVSFDIGKIKKQFKPNKFANSGKKIHFLLQYYDFVQIVTLNLMLNILTKIKQNKL